MDIMEPSRENITGNESKEVDSNVDGSDSPEINVKDIAQSNEEEVSQGCGERDIDLSRTAEGEDEILEAGKCTEEESVCSDEEVTDDERGSDTEFYEAVSNLLSGEGASSEEWNQFFRRFVDEGRQVPRLQSLIPLEHLTPKNKPFLVGRAFTGDCCICYNRSKLNTRVCCDKPVCDDCVRQHVNILVKDGVLQIPCLLADCKAFLRREEVEFFLTDDMKVKFHTFLVNANSTPFEKTCPQCCRITNVDEAKVRNANKRRRALDYVCEGCGLKWCFLCQAPWHEPLSCKQYMKGDKMLKKWAKTKVGGQANARKCPKCKVMIQRSEGCDHMSCSRCRAEFCYRCGDRYHQLKFIGNHYSKYSILGCKHNFKKDNPVARKLIRGSLFSLQVLAVPLVVALGAVAVVGAGIFVLPVYGSLKLHKRNKQRRRVRKASRKSIRVIEEVQVESKGQSSGLQPRNDVLDVHDLSLSFMSQQQEAISVTSFEDYLDDDLDDLDDDVSFRSEDFSELNCGRVLGE